MAPFLPRGKRKQPRTAIPDSWLKDPRLLGRRLDVKLHNTKGGHGLEPWRNGFYEGRTAFMVCEEPWPCKNPPIRVGVGHTYFKVNVQYLVPITTTERDDGDSAHAARPILATSGAIVIVTGPDLDGDTAMAKRLISLRTAGWRFGWLAPAYVGPAVQTYTNCGGSMSHS